MENIVFWGHEKEKKKREGGLEIGWTLWVVKIGISFRIFLFFHAGIALLEKYSS
jgi:hypothetical protein